MAFAINHTPSAFENALLDRFRHVARWLRAAALMSPQERALTRAMQTPLAVVKPANAHRRSNSGSSR